jgi:hypothetical protein
MGDYLRFSVNRTVSQIKETRINGTTYPLFTADYALYSLVYQGGYDGLFAEFAGNYSRQLTVALVCGAATVQHKQWGIHINWKYDEEPYLESGTEMYNDMVYAYESGAKYILVLDTDKNWTQDILQPEHLQAFQDFSQYVQSHPRSSQAETRTAFVLPADYGCGFRGPNDKIWGMWAQDSLSEVNMSSLINPALNNLLQVYGDNLDIVYEDTLEPSNIYGYANLIYWSDPNAQPTPTPSPTPSPTPTLSPTATPTASPSPTPTPSPMPSPSPTSTLSPSLSPIPTVTASPDARFFSSMDFLYVVAAGVIVAVGVVCIVFVLRRRQAVASQ